MKQAIEMLEIGINLKVDLNNYFPQLAEHMVNN
jgi:hypothetical protein